MAKKLEKNATKSHRERIEEMNKFLDSLSDVCPLFCFKANVCSIMTCLKLDLAKDHIRWGCRCRRREGCKTYIRRLTGRTHFQFAKFNSMYSILYDSTRVEPAPCPCKAGGGYPNQSPNAYQHHLFHPHKRLQNPLRLINLQSQIRRASPIRMIRQHHRFISFRKFTP